MKKLINEPVDYVDEALQGMLLANAGCYALSQESRRVVTRVEFKEEAKVGIVSGGGFGHLPLFAGYVGKGFLDTCAVGDVFAGPAGNDVAVALKAADKGAGILSVLGNYGGDRMTFEMQTELLRSSGVEAGIVVVNDDIASASKFESSKRRGVAGVVFAFKIAGAAAEAGLPLDEVKRITKKAIDNTRSIGVALGPCFIPQAGKPTFELENDTIEMGMGIHGEQGVWRGNLKSANDLANEMVDRLVSDISLNVGDQVAVLCNSFGATPIEELYIVYRQVASRLEGLGVEPTKILVGHYATSMEMAGASLSFMKLDNELTQYFDAPAICPFWNNVQ